MYTFFNERLLKGSEGNKKNGAESYFAARPLTASTWPYSRILNSIYEHWETNKADKIDKRFKTYLFNPLASLPDQISWISDGTWLTWGQFRHLRYGQPATSKTSLTDEVRSWSRCGATSFAKYDWSIRNTKSLVIGSFFQKLLFFDPLAENGPLC